MDSHDKPGTDHEDEVHLESQKQQVDLIDDYVPDTEEERKLVRKIDLYLLPAIWGMYLLSYMVRTMSVATANQGLFNANMWADDILAWETLR